MVSKPQTPAPMKTTSFSSFALLCALFLCFFSEHRAVAGPTWSRSLFLRAEKRPQQYQYRFQTFYYCEVRRTVSARPVAKPTYSHKPAVKVTKVTKPSSKKLIKKSSKPKAPTLKAPVQTPKVQKPKASPKSTTGSATMLAKKKSSVPTPVQRVKPQPISTQLANVTKFQVSEVFACPTSYSHEEIGSTNRESAKQVRLVYPDENPIGCVSISGTGDVHFGDLVIAEGKPYLAVDTGTDVINKVASEKRSNRMAKHNALYASPIFSKAPVLDFFMRKCAPVTAKPWATFTVVHCPMNFSSLKPSQRAEFLKLATWKKAFEQLETESSTKLFARR